MAQTIPPVHEMIAHVQAKASQDAAFRVAFLANPKGTVELEFGITLPELGIVQVIEAPADTVVVVLPRVAEAAADGALSDEDLASVAGGSKDNANRFFTISGCQAKGSISHGPAGFPIPCG